MKVRILQPATDDLIEGFHFYEEQGEGIGRYFRDSLVADIESLVVLAGIHEVVFGGYHRMVAKRFPFAIYYRLEADEAVVYAVLDCRRDPEWVRKRLRS